MELAKKFLFKLNTKSVKVLKEKSFVCYDTDTIKLVVEILENDGYKELYNSNIEVIFSYPNGESAPIKQTMEDGGIVIEEDSMISIIPKSGCLMPTDNLRVDINIYDEDEFITLQPFVFKVYKSKESEIFEAAQDVVKTMISINEQVATLKENVNTLTTKVEETSANIDTRLEVILQEANNKINGAKAEIDNSISGLNNSVAEAIENGNTQISNTIINGKNKINEAKAEIDNSISNLNNSVAVAIENADTQISNSIINSENKINEAKENADTQISNSITNSENKINDLVNVSNTKIQTFLNNSTAEVNNLLGKIENANIELDEVFLRSTPLEPIDSKGKILFTTETLLTSPTNLINKSYILTVSGSPYVSTVITSNIGFLYFTLEGDNVVINYSIIANKSVQGNSISIAPQFDNGKSNISKNSSNYKICISTNLLTSYVDNATCTITSNTTLSNNI